jgi:acyl-CoA thioester hydrolase
MAQTGGPHANEHFARSRGFLRQISFPDLLQIGVRLEKAGTSSVIYQLAVFRREDVEPSAVGRFVHVYVDTGTRRPVPIPSSIRAALDQL